MLGLLVARRPPRVEPASDDPWDGQTLEWTTSSPAPDDNFAEVPTVMSPEPVLDLTAAPDGEADLMTYALPAAPAAAAAPPAARRHRHRRRRRAHARSAGCSSLWIRLRTQVLDTGDPWVPKASRSPRSRRTSCSSVSPGCASSPSGPSTVGPPRATGARRPRARAGRPARPGDHQRPGVHLPAPRPADRRERVRRDVLRDHRHGARAAGHRGRVLHGVRLPLPRRPRRATGRSSPPMPVLVRRSPLRSAPCGWSST